MLKILKNFILLLAAPIGGIGGFVLPIFFKFNENMVNKNYEAGKE
jgi:hypothetical protein